MPKLVAALIALFIATGVYAQGNYAIQPGDSLRVEVIEDASLNRDVLVTPDGRISFPFAGSVPAAGRTTEQLERALASRLEANFANPPSVYVAVRGLAPQSEQTASSMISVFLLGEVNSPGPKEVEPGTSILQFLSTSGGFSKFAATKRVQVRRRAAGGAERVITLNYHAISRGAVMQNDVVLHDGDVVLVPERRLFE
jgi:polysaccharide export outer membrane protein